MATLDPAIQSLLKDPKALIPAIVQDFTSHEVLMLAYMSAESLAMTIESGKATYWSRSRNELWVKGATSGHFQEIHSISLDCDGDALLLTVTQIGVACHTGNATCFHQSLNLGS
jgi:phosphoribosyl-AMP cyclohydrolase